MVIFTFKEHITYKYLRVVWTTKNFKYCIHTNVKGETNGKRYSVKNED